MIGLTFLFFTSFSVAQECVVVCWHTVIFFKKKKPHPFKCSLLSSNLFGKTCLHRNIYSVFWNVTVLVNTHII